MGRRPTVNAEVAAIVATQTVLDPELAARARALGNKAIDEAERVFREGHPDAKKDLLKILLPAMVKTEKAEEDEERVKMRETLRELHQDAGLGQ